MKNTTIVHFHVGRGGRFNNPGFVSYCGEATIGEVLSMRDGDGGRWPFLNPLNYHEARLIIKREEFCKFPLITESDDNSEFIEKLVDLLDYEKFDEFEALTGFELGEPCYFDGNGVDIITEAQVNTGVGVLDWDGGYDKDYCKYLIDCDYDEIILIASHRYGNQDLIEAWIKHNYELQLDLSDIEKEKIINIIEDLNSNQFTTIEDYKTQSED